jgi:hypothetical protein
MPVNKRRSPKESLMHVRTLARDPVPVELTPACIEEMQKRQNLGGKGGRGGGRTARSLVDAFAAKLKGRRRPRRRGNSKG